MGWRVCGAPFTAPPDVEFDEARVYWNGAIHWFSMTDTSLYFDLSVKLVLEMTMPPPFEYDCILECCDGYTRLGLCT